MKPFLHLLLLVAFAVNATFAQQNDKPTDPKLGKHGYWIFYGADRPDLGIPAQGKVEEGYYYKDRKEGMWIRYHEDGVTPKLKGMYVNNRPHGCYEKFYPSGQLRESGNFMKNVWRDSVKRYFENGQLEYEAWYNENGREEGRVNYFYVNGQLEITYVADNGSPMHNEYYDTLGNLIPHYHGPVVDYIPIEYAPVSAIKSPLKDTTVQRVPAPVIVNPPESFKPNSYNKVYNDDGEIWQDGMFKEGQLWDGKVYVYDRDGILVNVRVFKSGLYHSDGQL